MNRRHLLATMLTAPLWACGSDHSLVSAVGEPATPNVDADPLALLPSSPLFVWRIDGPALFGTTIGAHVSNLMSSLLPLGPDSGLLPARDIRRVYAGLYAMQGADTCAVLQGTYNKTAIENAAQMKARTGTTVVETFYAGHGMYTIGNLGFVALTPGTIVTGNETGLRRALDRLRSGENDTPPPDWMVGVLEDARAPFAMVGEVREHGALAAAQERLPFVDGLLIMRVLGNFDAPGFNIVGNLSYRDEQTAARGVETLADVRKMAFFASMMATMGGAASTPELEARQIGASVAFAGKFETQLAVLFLTILQKLLQPGGTGQIF